MPPKLASHTGHSTSSLYNGPASDLVQGESALFPILPREDPADMLHGRGECALPEDPVMAAFADPEAMQDSCLIPGWA